MADVHSAATRSKNMRAIRTQDTAIELRVAALLEQRGFTFHAQDKTLPGKPDFVVPAHQAILLVHGCFWHHHHCYLFKTPATRTQFWLDKIDGNVTRDTRDREALREQGWKVLVVWECALRGKLRLDDRAIGDRLEEWLFTIDGAAEIDYQGIHLLKPAKPA